MAKAGLAGYNGSLGLALAKPQQDGSFTLDQVWDDPQKFVWFVDGWGPNWQRYAGNAVRKLRPMLRVGRGSTLDLRFDHPELFQDKVDSANPDGTLPWGDFPRGGGVFECADDIILAGAVSGLKETEDDTVARLFLGSLATKIIAGDGLLSDD